MAHTQPQMKEDELRTPDPDEISRIAGLSAGDWEEVRRNVQLTACELRPDSSGRSAATGGRLRITRSPR